MNDFDLFFDVYYAGRAYHEHLKPFYAELAFSGDGHLIENAVRCTHYVNTSGQTFKFFSSIKEINGDWKKESFSVHAVSRNRQVMFIKFL